MCRNAKTIQLRHWKVFDAPYNRKNQSQFGHNDESKEKTDRYTNPEDFKNNLTKFVNEARALKAIPILFTPVSRRKFDSLGNAQETHQIYSALVKEVAEKNPISDDATVGIYYWKKGSDYVKYAESMIKENIRTNNEFYVCPVFNQAIEDNCKIKIKQIDRMWGIGTPEDLEYFLNHYKK